MILHNCIECDFFEMIPLANGQLPKFQKYICPKCKTIQWIKHSRIEPVTYSTDQIKIDEKNKSIEVINDQNKGILK